MNLISIADKMVQLRAIGETPKFLPCKFSLSLFCYAVFFKQKTKNQDNDNTFVNSDNAESGMETNIHHP